MQNNQFLTNSPLEFMDNYNEFLKISESGEFEGINWNKVLKNGLC